MRKQFTFSFLLITGLLLASASGWAHHGQGLSFATDHMWTTWATVEQFHYINPHPAIEFSRVDKNGKVEHWSAECGNNPSRMARDGWTKTRSLALLKPGTKVKLYVGTSLAGGFNGIVNRIENEKGEAIVETGEVRNAVDMEGVPSGYQPTAEDKAKAAKASSIDIYDKDQK
jgi:Family of unknown function (DUF6152)